MGKIAFVFSGQGDQYPGMGKELAEKYPAASIVFGMCDRLRPGTSTQCFEGTEEELKETKNTQPCLYAFEMAAVAVLREKGYRPSAVAGFSLGEVAAAAAADIFDYETGFQLVCKRGELMQREAEKFDTAMAAVVKLTPEQVQEICGKYTDVYAVNFNAPGQVSVSGLVSQMKEFSAEVKKAGGRAIPLKVKGAFHSPFMEGAAHAFEAELAKVDMKDMAVKLYSNLTSKPYTDDATGLLSKQISNPVQWEKLVRNMIKDGIDTFIEIGPGKTLTNMIRKIAPEVTACSVMDYLTEVGSC